MGVRSRVVVPWAWAEAPLETVVVPSEMEVVPLATVGVPSGKAEAPLAMAVEEALETVSPWALR